MAAVGGAGESVLAVALDDFENEISVSDFENRDVLVAWSLNGRRMRVRDKVPLWIIYPKESGANSQSREARVKMVWQVRELRVK